MAAVGGCRLGHEKIGLDYKPYKINKDGSNRKLESYILGIWTKRWPQTSWLQNMPADLFRGETTAFAPGEKGERKVDKTRRRFPNRESNKWQRCSIAGCRSGSSSDGYDEMDAELFH